VAIPRGRQSLRLRGFDLDELLACLSGNGIFGVAAVLNVKLNGFTDVAQRFGVVVPFANASGQRGDAGDVAATATDCYFFTPLTGSLTASMVDNSTL
jgi:hypothetical protein